MRKVLTLFVLACFLCVGAYAETVTTGPGDWDPQICEPIDPYIKKGIEKYLPHDHQVNIPDLDERNPEWNVGAEAIYRVAEKGQEGENETLWEWLIPDWIKGSFDYDVMNTTSDDKWKFGTRAVYFIN